MAMTTELRSEIERLVDALIAGRYDALVEDGRAGRLSADELRTAIAEYGRTLVPLPNDAWHLVEEHSQVGEPDALAMDIALWTMEEGRSDLTLSLTAHRRADAWGLAIDDLHVL
jgi:hypothetical protein